MRSLITTSLILLICFSVQAQKDDDKAKTALKDRIMRQKMVKDSLKWEAIFARATYPLIKDSKYSGVIPVKDVTEIPDPNQKYKLLMEITDGIKDSIKAKDIYSGLAEIGRIINLHIASGIPKENLELVAVVHGGALNALFTDKEYNNKYHLRNPNLQLIKQLTDAGVKFIACGQAMNFREVTKDQMIPGVKVSLTAQTVLSNYQLKGYVLYALKED